MSSATNTSTEIATFAAGCFWGVEHIFLKHFPPKENKGIKTAVGYTGGKETVTNPGYRDVCSGETDHAEALRIEFDPTIVSYADLVEFFYRTHEPTTVNRQGNDRGTRRAIYYLHTWGSSRLMIFPEYRSAIFANTPKQLETALAVTEEVQQKHFTPKGEKIVTQIVEAGPWYDAEDYHQLYLFKNPNGYQCATHRLHW
ncbi:peptide methionine sulfoxide reductase [Lentinula edodes]|uniref:peptide-methionine (S)-S-oxide reductase n=1 Tax=Lentinula lateritia TaxID=40482 RepID=A0A9W9AYU5_9AGAR|nr:peptide methionine sulfoxide reductase [Lentinula edodes]